MFLSLKTKVTTMLIVLGVVYSAWFYYVDTLSMSEIVGQSDSAVVDIFVNLFDFDTGITRHEISQLSQKSKGWNLRMDEIMRIQDQTQRQAEHEKLVAEMMRDPAFKKIAQMILRTVGKTAKSTLDILSSFKTFGLF